MDSIHSREGRWSISPCTCTEGTIHFAYGNATLHILAEDLWDLGVAMQSLAECAAGSVDDRAARKKGALQ